MEAGLKVLFVSSGNSKNFELSPLINAQKISLEEQGLEVDFFPVIGKGLFGYLKSAKKLRIFLKDKKYDVIHAHYSLCGWTTILARTGIPIVISLMGTDAHGIYNSGKGPNFFSRYLTLFTWFVQPFSDAIISKSSNIDTSVYRRKIANIIPNGVKMVQFPVFDYDFRKELGLNQNKKYLLFLGNKQDPNKNHVLVEKALKVLNDPDIELIAPYPVPHDTVVKYFWAADVFVHAAFMEGSPNVVKEAMACNCPIVATDVGDIKWVLGDTDGCYVSSFDAVDFASNIKKSLDFVAKYGRTQGRKRIIELGLDSETVANKIIGVYQNVLKRRKA
jgi:teichuronic acid biosynthesis glycosyltransferase TuaC